VAAILMPMLSHMEYRKTLLYVGGLVLAMGGPITVFSGTDFVTGIKRTFSASSAATASAAPQQPVAASSFASPELPSVSSQFPPTASIRSSSATAVDNLPSPSLAEVLNFNATVDWVMRRWSRVSTGLPDLQLQGYRVALVTGTSMADVAGSLTYYFNSQQRLQRITLRGTTGDPSALVALLSGHFGFTRRLTNDPGVVLYEKVDSNNKSAGTLKIRSARLIKANQPYTRFEVDLAVDRPE
jgi:hypothetical protein